MTSIPPAPVIPRPHTDDLAVPSRLAVLGLAVLALASVTAACGTPSAPSPPAPSVVATVSLPPPSSDGPVLTVDGQANWATEHPGCALLRTDSGQVLQLVGPAADQRLGEVRSGTTPQQQRVRVTGYVPRVGASVCGAQRSFVAEKVTDMNR